MDSGVQIPFGLPRVGIPRAGVHLTMKKYCPCIQVYREHNLYTKVRDFVVCFFLGVAIGIASQKGKAQEGNAEVLWTKGFERMRINGAKYTADEYSLLEKLADADDDGKLSLDEVTEAYGTVLNPEHPLGKLALPYDGPAPPVTLEQHMKLQTLYMKHKRWHSLIFSLTDENKDKKISEEEARRAVYKVLL